MQPSSQSPPPDSHESQARIAKRQKKDEVERTRATRACDRCKQKKTRCTGRQPCILCTRSGKTCAFTASYTRGRLPSIFPEESEYSETVNDISASQIINRAIDQRERHESQGEASRMPSLPTPTSDHPPIGFDENLVRGRQVHISGNDSQEPAVVSSRASPEPPQTDLQGHYVGPSSGVSFLLRVQRKLHQKVSFTQNTSIFTFGDAPLPNFDPSFFVLPPKDAAQELVARYFEYAVATHRFLHRPTIEAWLQEFYENMGVMQIQAGAKEKTALLFMVFAQAKEYMPETTPRGADTSARYFQAADHQLSSETGEVRLTSVQARLCQCFYLLSLSRVNHCWNLFGTTAHLILAIGIHRKRRFDSSGRMDLVELECRKRVFWCAYGLDNYLSAALGRPRTFHDEDIDQDLPTCVNDSDLTPQRINLSSQKGQSIMMASVAHNTQVNLKLQFGIAFLIHRIGLQESLVIFFVTCTRYAPLPSRHADLSRFLDADGFDPSLLMPLFQRQRNVLNLAYYHALILIFRPFLLSNFASLSSRTAQSRGGPGTSDMNSNVGKCLDAAMHIAGIVNELTEGRQIFRAFWFTQYFAFCAVVVLYVYTIQQRQQPPEKYQVYFNAAEKCQEQISQIGGDDSLAQRYSVVLEELRLEAVKVTHRYTESQYTNFEASSTLMQTSVQPVDSIELDRQPQAVFVDMFSHDSMPAGGQSETTPTNTMTELMSWGEFDSLVTAGVGGLDFMFLGDANRTAWEETTGPAVASGTTMS